MCIVLNALQGAKIPRRRPQNRKCAGVNEEDHNDDQRSKDNEKSKDEDPQKFSVRLKRALEVLICRLFHFSAFVQADVGSLLIDFTGWLSCLSVSVVHLVCSAEINILYDKLLALCKEENVKRYLAPLTPLPAEGTPQNINEAVGLVKERVAALIASMKQRFTERVDGIYCLAALLGPVVGKLPVLYGEEKKKYKDVEKEYITASCKDHIDPLHDHERNSLLAKRLLEKAALMRKFKDHKSFVSHRSWCDDFTNQFLDPSGAYYKYVESIANGSRITDNDNQPLNL